MADDFSIRCGTPADVERLVAFNARVFRPSAGAWAQELLSGRHPTVSPADFSIVEVDGSIASSLCVIRQRWGLEGVPLDVAQIELVATDDRYRRRGLIRRQLEWRQEYFRNHHCSLVSVKGVPAVYQRLGYEFAVPAKGGVRLQSRQIPAVDAPDGGAIRRCESRDLPALERLDRHVGQGLAVRLERDRALWAYQECQSAESEHAYETWVLDRHDRAAAYVRWCRRQTSDALVVAELGVESYADLLVLATFLKARAADQGSGDVVLQLPECHPATAAARGWGGSVVPPYAWQVRVLDWPALLAAIRPVLDARLSRSLMRDSAGSLRIHVAELDAVIALRIDKGRIAAIAVEDAAQPAGVRLTEALLVQLVLGYRSVAEIEASHLEARVGDAARYLGGVLFPRVHAFIHEPY